MIPPHRPHLTIPSRVAFLYADPVACFGLASLCALGFVFAF